MGSIFRWTPEPYTLRHGPVHGVVGAADVDIARLFVEWSQGQVFEMRLPEAHLPEQFLKRFPVPTSLVQIGKPEQPYWSWYARLVIQPFYDLFAIVRKSVLA